MKRTKKELIELLTAANKKLEKYNAADKDFTATFDRVLDRLQEEYDERLKLKKKLAEARVALAASEYDGQKVLAILDEAERALEISLGRLRSIRQQVESTRLMVAEEKSTAEKIDGQLQAIAKSAEVTIISVTEMYRHSRHRGLPVRRVG